MNPKAIHPLSSLVECILLSRPLKNFKNFKPKKFKKIKIKFFINNTKDFCNFSCSIKIFYLPLHKIKTKKDGDKD
jgi:hypothetical protein